MRRMIADGFDTFYEMGPGRVLTGLLKRIDRKTPCTNIPARVESVPIETMERTPRLSQIEERSPS